MSKVKRLLQSYNDYISVPWRDDAAAAQRVIFCVYNETEERTLRVKIDEFEITTRSNGHDWCTFDLTNSFGAWVMSRKYANKYFLKPELLEAVLFRYLEYIEKEFIKYIKGNKVDENTVVALYGIGSLFGFVKVKDIVDILSPLVDGRLLVFFPGSYENNNYRLLDGYDGWNYLAVPITENK